MRRTGGCCAYKNASEIILCKLLYLNDLQGGGGHALATY